MQHVPNLRKSFLSLRKFDEDGCELYGRNDQLIIIKGALVVAKGELKDRQILTNRKNYGWRCWGCQCHGSVIDDLS